MAHVGGGAGVPSGDVFEAVHAKRTHHVRTGWLEQVQRFGPGVLVVAAAGLTAWSLVTWGVGAAIAGAGAVALGILVPVWALVRVTSTTTSWFVRVHAAVVWTVVGAAIVVLLAGLWTLEYPFLDGWQPTRPALAVAAAVLGVVVLLATLMGMGSVQRTNAVVDMAIVRVSVWVLIGLVATGIAALPVYLTYGFAAEGQSFAGGPSSAWRETAAANLGVAPTLGLLLPHLGAWSTSILYTGLLAFAYHRTRARRVERLQTLRDRLDETFARRLVSKDTRTRLRQHIDRELTGALPAESVFLRSRAAVSRIGSLAALFFLLGVGLLFVAVQSDVPAVSGSLGAEAAEACPGCTSVEEYQRFQQAIGDHRHTLFMVAATSFLMALYAALVVPLLVRRMHQAEREVELVWGERDELERRMLAEMRAASVDRATGPAGRSP